MLKKILLNYKTYLLLVLAIIGLQLAIYNDLIKVSSVTGDTLWKVLFALVLVFNILFIVAIFKKRYLILKILVPLFSLVFWVLIAVGYVVSHPPENMYDYYSASFYRDEFKSATGLSLSEASKIVAKNDSKRDRGIGAEAEVAVQCVIKLSTTDKAALLTLFKKENLSPGKSISKFDFENSWGVPSDGARKGLQIQDFRNTYNIQSEKDAQDHYVISFHKDGKRILFGIRYL